MENNIVYGGKGGDKPGYYESAVDVLKRLGKIKIGFFGSKYLPTQEKHRRDFYYVTREHAENMLKYFEQQDWDAIATLPREKDGTSCQLKIDHVDSGKYISAQVVEARAGSDGGYFNITPAVLFFDEEAEKRMPGMSKLFEK